VTVKTFKQFTAALAAGAAALVLASCGNGAANAPAANNAAAPANAAAAPGANPFAAMGGPSAAAPAPTTVHYVNQLSPGADPSQMADFSFDYPADMRQIPGKAWIFLAKPNAAGANAQLVFGVSPAPAVAPDALESQISQLGSQMSGGDGYQEINHGPTTFGGWPAMQVNFSEAPTMSNGQRVVAYGRIIYIPGPGGAGNAMVMLIAFGAPDVQTIDQLGTTGELATIANSFKMGK
jgi:hypothetical protein